MGTQLWKKFCHDVQGKVTNSFIQHRTSRQSFRKVGGSYLGPENRLGLLRFLCSSSAPPAKCYLYCYYYLYFVIVVVSCHTPVLPGISPEPTAIPTTQTAELSVLCVLFLVQLSVVVSLLNVLLLWFKHFFLKPFVFMPEAPTVTGIIIHFVFNIRC
jgi:hypothetical protein